MSPLFIFILITFIINYSIFLLSCITARSRNEEKIKANYSKDKYSYNNVYVYKKENGIIFIQKVMTLRNKSQREYVFFFQHRKLYL